MKPKNVVISLLVGGVIAAFWCAGLVKYLIARESAETWIEGE